MVKKYRGWVRHSPTDYVNCQQASICQPATGNPKSRIPQKHDRPSELVNIKCIHAHVQPAISAKQNVTNNHRARVVGNPILPASIPQGRVQKV